MLDKLLYYAVFFFQAEDGIRDHCVTGVQTCALPILPVMMTSPGSMTKYCEQAQTMWRQSKIMVEVLPRWRFSPLTSSHMSRFCGFLISSLVTSHGPSGPNVSQPLPLVHCPARSI